MAQIRYRKQEYATKLTIIGIFLAIFTGFASHLQSKKSKKQGLDFKPLDLALLGLSTYRLGRLVAFEKVFDPIRAPFTEEKDDVYGAGKVIEAKGEGVIKSLGELISCPICAGTWISAALVYAIQMFPNPTRIFLWIHSSIGIAEILNALTEALTWSGNAARKRAGGNSK
jgi:hypothetical protein